MEQFRNSLRDIHTGEIIKTTPLSFIIRALVKALIDFPIFNSSLDIANDKMILKKYFHIGIAVDTPHGLMVPKIRDVEKKNITALGKELKNVSEACRNSKVDKKEFYGGSMTISSLGGIGGSFFTPIINFPEVAILGVGRAETKQIYFDEKKFVGNKVKIIDNTKLKQIIKDIKFLPTEIGIDKTIKSILTQ